MTAPGELADYGIPLVVARVLVEQAQLITPARGIA